jgi:hypothetical protein
MLGCSAVFWRMSVLIHPKSILKAFLCFTGLYFSCESTKDIDVIMFGNEGKGKAI